MKKANFKGIVQQLDKRKETISSMESCTGGSLASRITDIEGAGDVLHYSAITYSNCFKEKMGVDAHIIKKYTVYSIEVAHEMSRKISEFTNSDYGIGITGTLNCEDPVNPCPNPHLVYISIYLKRNNCYVDEVMEVYNNSRILNKEAVLCKVEKLLINILK